MRRSHFGIATAGLVGVLLLGGCTADSTEPPPDASDSEGMTSNEPQVSDTVSDAWRDEYTQGELAAYDSALARWTEYEMRAAPIWAQGKATQAAEALFQEYLASPTWQIVLDRLETYERVKVRVPRPPEIFWSRPARISVRNGGASVAIEQCVDLTAQGTTQYGEPVEWPKVFRKPVVRELVLDQRADGPWLVTSNEPPNVDRFTRCSQEPGS